MVLKIEKTITKLYLHRVPIERQVEISHSQYHVDQYEGSDS